MSGKEEGEETVVGLLCMRGEFKNDLPTVIGMLPAGDHHIYSNAEGQMLLEEKFKLHCVYLKHHLLYNKH